MRTYKTISEFIDNSALSAQTKTAVSKWCRYRIGYGQRFSAADMRELLEQAERNEAEYGSDAIAALVDTCIEKNYRELYFEKLCRIVRPPVNYGLTKEIFEYTKEVYRMVSGKEWYYDEHR